MEQAHNLPITSSFAVSDNTLKQIARTIIFISVMMMFAGLLLQLVALFSSEAEMGLSTLELSRIPAMVAYLIVSWLIIMRHPQHTVGWILCLIGFSGDWEVSLQVSSRLNI